MDKYYYKYQKYKNKYLALKNIYINNQIGSTRTIKIAIVGEGPVGLLCILYLISNKYKMHNDKIKIYWYIKRDKYTRRHIINISKKTVLEITNILNNCENCIKINDQEQLLMSILCFEKMLYSYIDSQNITKYIGDENIELNLDIIKDYDHIFFADGYSSINRHKFIFEGINFSPIKATFYNPILVLYYNIEPVNSENCNTDNVGNKKSYHNNNIIKYALDIYDIQSFVAIIYRINLWFDEFNKTNLWINGFVNYNEFLEVFNKTILFIENNDKKIIMETFKSNNSNITDKDIYFLNNINEMKILFEKYKSFVFNELSTVGAVTNNFIIHSVMPNCSLFGIVLEDGWNRLLFSKKIENTYIYCIGDSAASYPPGYSLEIGLLTVFNYFPFLLSNLFSDNININKKYEFTICDALKILKFKGGYRLNNPKNDDEISCTELINIISSKINTDDMYVDYYNSLQINTFLYNLNKIMCHI